jgi:radical SAM superfamily enzyme YgiQ (UPF0313 family)
MAEIVLVNPRFEVSYWGFEHALGLFGKRANMPVASLPLLAALTPDEHQVSIVDENIEAIDFDRLARADIVGLTGMSVQRFRCRDILTELKRRGAFTVVGGPWVSVDEDYFDELADVIFVGEAEETWPQFLEDWSHRSHHTRYEQTEKTDMSRVPPPRLELLNLAQYIFGSVQFSRGCPFQCEFCDIIVTFGRRPRLKSATQVIREIEVLLERGMEMVFVVDDNLIGNKKAIKELLRELAAWQQRRGFPVMFFTEASLDLADDPELMQLLGEANFVSVFVGIESTNEDSLRETKKFQNVRPHGSLLEKVRRIQDAGLEVWCGMILGFDHDDETVFESQRHFIQESRILHAMVGMLNAFPKTPLYDRLALEGRLDPEDESVWGTNVIPQQLGRGELRDGYVKLMNDLYDPESYFERLDALYLREQFCFARPRTRYWRRHPFRGMRDQGKNLIRFLGMALRLLRRVPDPSLRTYYSQQLWRLVRTRRDPAVLLAYVVKCAIHFHHYTMARQMASHERPVLSHI